MQSPNDLIHQPVRLKIMAALNDVQQNGPAAMQKYANAPEITSVIKELQEIMG